MLLTAQNIVGFFLTLDRDLFIWISLIALLVAVGITALLSRNRTWLELIAILLTTFVVTLFLAHLIFKYIVDVPFVRVDTVSLITDT